MAEKMNIYEKLAHIQNEMKVPKNLYNQFGKYYYRNAETILEVAKSVCAKYRATLTVEDEIICVHGASHKKIIDDNKETTTDVATEGRFYVKAMAVLHDWDDGGSFVVNTAYARECEKKAGMDDSQLTGSCSSYARKYALNGLFCLDDVKDADTDEQETERNEKAKKSDSKPKETKTKEPQMASDKQINYILQLYSNNEIGAMLKRMKKETLKDLTKDEASKMIASRGGE